jgi:dihydropteroate synthase
MVMGVLNITPDSFSDGGRFPGPEAAADRALQMEEQGAEIIDVGGESTRPGAREIGVEEEIRRVVPVLERLQGRVRSLVSIDTRKPEVARAAIQAGAGMINNVGGAGRDEQMAELAAMSGAAYVVMHMRGTPETMQAAPAYDDVAGAVENFFAEKSRMAVRAGAKEEQLVLDVGIGFGKNLEHNLELLRATGRFAAMGRPLLLGVSRKSFIGALLGLELMERLPAALACAVWAVRAGAGIIRTHDVAETRAALRMAEAIEKGPQSGDTK